MDVKGAIVFSGVIKYYIYDIALFIFAFRTIRKIWECRPLIEWERYIQRGWRIRSEWVKELLETCYFICIILFYAAAAQEFVIASILDLPQVVTNSYYDETGVVRKVTKSSLTVEVKNGKLVTDKIYDEEYKEYQIGDQVCVLYYEHMSDAVVYTKVTP